MNDPHSILGLDPSAPPKAVKAAYRKLALELHPDKAGGSPQATATMARINEAYEALKSRTASTPADRQDHPSQHTPHHSAPRTEPRFKTYGYGMNTKRAGDYEYQARKDAELRERQAREWTGSGDPLRAQRQRSAEELAQAEAAGRAAVGGDPTSAAAEARAAQMRALRQSRAARASMDAPPTYDSREAMRQRDAARAAARADVRSHAGRTPAAPGEMILENVSGLGRQEGPEVTLSGRQDKAMDTALQDARKSEARDRVQAARHGVEREEATFHKAQKMSLQGDTLVVHTGSRGEAGRNIVAIPEITSSGGRLKVGNKVQLVDMSLSSSGRATPTLDEEKSPVKNGGVKVALAFSDQRENLRGRENSTTRD